MSKKRIHILGVVLTSFLCFFLLMSFSKRSVSGSRNDTPFHLFPTRISEVTTPDLTIKQGYVSQKKEIINIVRDGKIVAKVELSKPVVVAQADKEEKWGFFQFPGIGRTDDGKLIVGWQMNEDSHRAYGKGNTGRMMSQDEGKNWELLDKDYFVKGSRDLVCNNGDYIQIYTPISKSIKGFSSFPEAVAVDSHLNMNFFLEHDLPEDLKGMYLNVRNNQTKTTVRVHGELDDPNLMRYSIDDLMPLMWWGELKELEDGTLVGGIYRTYYYDHKNNPSSCITFYKSKDRGEHWKAMGRIPYLVQELNDKSRKYDNTRGFSEATFEILKDGTFFCVMRTGYNTPMYRTYSYDGGCTWTEPEAFTPNGVKPKLLLFDNDIMVLASGRPGLQLRFCLDGDGKIWTEPIEMMPYMNDKGEYDMWEIGCGYPALLQVDSNTFYLAYSDFQRKDASGVRRKAILFRKVSITK